jgi:GT2 family glycosyltransferase
MNISVIVCSHRRHTRLLPTLTTIEAEASLYSGTEIVLVYAYDDPETAAEMEKFAKTSRVPVKIGRAERNGLSVARNVGIAHATGDILFFTDDDCYMKEGHLGAVLAAMEEEAHYGYGGGGVHDVVSSPPGTTHVSEKAVIGPRTLIGAGVFSGCNMFFRKEVFEKLGGFREDMGAGSGTKFIGAEDLEMTTRANFSGYSGVLVPNAVIIHDHGRLANTPELRASYIDYEIERGAFYAYMYMHGIHEIWPFWARYHMPDKDRKLTRGQIESLQREFYGASEYLDYCLKNNIDM